MTLPATAARAARSTLPETDSRADDSRPAAFSRSSARGRTASLASIASTDSTAARKPSAELKSREPGRPRKLTREAIVAAAIRLMEAQGRGALTLRALGKILGVQFSTLYNYFPGIDQLTGAAVTQLLDEVPLPDAAASDVRAQLTAHYLAVRTLLIRYPDVLDLKPGSVSWKWSLRRLEAELGVLRGAGLAPEDAIVAIAELGGLCTASASLARTWGGDPAALKRQLLAGQSETQLPQIAALLQKPLTKLTSEAIFRETIEVLLDHHLPKAAARGRGKAR